MVNTKNQTANGPVSVFYPPDIGPDHSKITTSVKFTMPPTQEAVDGIRFDFGFGFRVMIPANAIGDYIVSFYDMTSGLLLEKHTLKAGDFLVGERKYFIPYRMEIARPTGKTVFVHEYDCRNRRVYIVIPEGGLGDNLAWVPLADLFRRKYGADVYCICGEWIISLVASLYPGLHFVPELEKAMLADSYANYFCGIFEKDRKSWRPVDHQLLGMQGAVEAILGLEQGPVKCRLPLGSARPFPDPYVCISTMATSPGKYWNYPDGWNEIIRFLRGYGYRVFDIDREKRLNFAGKDYSIPEEAEDFTGAFPLQERIDLLEHADFFIGLPSGLSWLAWNVGIPVVMLSGFTMPNCEFPTPYRVTNTLFCHGCWNDSECFFDQKVPVWCPRHIGTPREIECTRAITPKMVRETILRIPAFQQRAAALLLSASKETK